MTTGVKEVVAATKEVAKAAKDAGIEDKVVQMLDALQHGAVQVGDAVVKYSPDIADTLLWVVRIDGLQRLFTAFVLLVISIASFIVFKKSRKHAWLEGPKYNQFPTLACVIGILALLISSTAFINCLDTFVCIWNWIAVFQPKLWLAKQIINSAIH